MSTTFWIELGITAIVGLILTIIANYYNDRIIKGIENRKKLRLNKRREDEVKNYHFVKKLIEGKPEAYLTFVSAQTSAVILLIMSLVLFVVGILFSIEYDVLIKVSPTNPPDRLGYQIGTNAVFLLAFLILFMSYRARVHHRDIVFKLHHFEEYTKELINKWGQAAIEP